MPYWVYGRDAKNGHVRDPLFVDADDEADARRQAEELGMIVDELEFTKPVVTATDEDIDSTPAELPLWGGYRPNSELILTTTPTIQGREIKRFAGIVNGLAIVSPGPLNAIRDAFGRVGGRSLVYEREFQRARNLALADMEAAALALDANAVVGLQFQFDMVNAALIVSVTGTAVILDEPPRAENSSDPHFTT